MRAAGAYAQMCAGDLDGVEEMIDEMLELIDGDPTERRPGSCIELPGRLGR